MKKSTQINKVSKKQHFYNVFFAADCLANAIAKGNRQGTISSRTYYNAVNSPNQEFWVPFMYRINKSFEVLDGANHCENAYHWERDKEQYDATYVDQCILKLFTYPVCFALDHIINPIILWKKRDQ